MTHQPQEQIEDILIPFEGMKLSNFLVETDTKHTHIVDSFAYAMAAEMYRMQEEYVLLYIKNRPKWLPSFIYKWLLSKLFVLARFKQK